MVETVKQYMSKTRADYGSGIARPTIANKDNFELKGQFLKELRDNTFSGLNHEDANEHIKKVLEIMDLFHNPNITIDQVMLISFLMSLTRATSRWLRNKPSGSITTWEDLKIKFLRKYCPPAHTTKKMEEINNFQQEPDENLYQAWTRSTKTSEGAIQAQLDNLGREIKKVNEKVYAAQAGCKQCKGPHYTKDCPLKEEGKTREKAYYAQFGPPFQGGGYRATTSGFYQRNNVNPSYQERRQSMEDTLSKFMISETSKKDLEDLFQKIYDEYFDSSKIMKSLTTNVETFNVKVPLNEEEVFHESFESFQEESSSSSLNDDVQQSSEETKDHPFHKIIGDPKSSVRTRVQLANSCLFSCLLSSIELANVAEALRDADWVSAMQEELDQFARLKIAFLNGILKEEVYVGKPTGFVSKQYPDHVYALDKALYGLKQAPRAWYDVLLQFLIDCVPTPMVEQAKLKLDLIGKPVDPTDYRSMIESLMYVTSSRSDIMFATCMCARYQANPNEHHVSAVKRIFCYLKGTINLGFWYLKDSGFDLTAYSDADHTGCHLDQKSTSGSVQFLGDKLVYWSSKKQNCVSISIAESEYIAVSSCYAQVL
nr:hypothetical protein [Tanacetum cinerariifolium]